MGIRRSPSPDRSRSASAESNRSGPSRHSNASGGSNRSRSASRSRSRSRSRSGSPGSNRSRSRSGSAQSDKSHRSHSSVHSGKSGRSRSGSKSPPSPRSVRSGSRSRSASRSRSRSAGSNRSGSNASHASNRSKSRSRSHSRSRSRSGSPSHKSRSRSASVQSNKSYHSTQSNKSNHSALSAKSKSKSRSPDRRSRSKSKSPARRSRSRSGSQSPQASPKPKEAKGSDSEGDKGADAADLFGDADDISSDEDKAKESTVRKLPSDDEDDRPERMERDDRSDRSGDEEDREKRDDEKEGEDAEVVPETRIDVKIPKISCDLGKEIHFVKLPNFLSVETRPFDPETYEDEIDEEETLDEEGRARLKLKVENTMRWRDEINKDGDFVKQSNARLVRWSDGSLSLHLGSEIFDVYKQPLQGDHNHLFIRQGTGLQGQAVFRTKLSFRPHSTESFTHRKMTLSLADRSQKTSGIKILSQVGIDPDQDRKSLLKKEEEKLRQTFRQTKPRKRGDGSRSHAGATYREEDGSEDEGAISLNAIKNKYKSGSSAVQSKGGAIYSSDEEGSDFEARRSKKLDKPKALKDSESSDDSD